MTAKTKPRPQPVFAKKSVDMGALKQELGKRFTRRPLHQGGIPIAVNFGDLKTELGQGK